MLLWKHKVFYLQAATYLWTQLTKALDCFSNTVQIMTATAVHSLQISVSYSCIMRLAIHGYTETLKRHRKKLSLGCVLPKTLQRGLYCGSQKRLSPKHEDGLSTLAPLGSTREFTPVPGYSTQELCMKKQISSQGNFCLLECLPYNPILWSTCFGNAAQSGDGQRPKGSDSFQRTVEKQGTTSNTLMAAFCLATSVSS